MPVLILEESNYVGPIPDDQILAVRITAVNQRTKPFKDKDGGEIVKIEFSFVVEDPTSPFDGQRVWGETSTVFNTSPDCKLRNWVQEVLGAELPAGFALDTDDLVGNMARAIMGSRTYDRDGQQKTVNFVKDLMRARNGNAFASVSTDADADEPF